MTYWRYKHTIFTILGLIACTVLLALGFKWQPFSKFNPLNATSRRQSISIDSKMYLQENKQRGGHVFGRLDTANVQMLKEHNYDWITLVPFADQEDYDSPDLRYYWGDRTSLIQRDSMYHDQIHIAHAAGLKVFLKPHIWMHDASAGKWRSDIYPSSEENWLIWQQHYQEFIMSYAKIAADNDVELFCIGTELSRLSVEKPEFWTSLIKEVRKVYKGKLTYAANWYEEYEHIVFWKELDFIGVQAYFPLVDNHEPTVAQLSKAWSRYIPTLENLSRTYDRQVLFTEMGYKSTTDSAIRPWEWIEYPINTNKIYSSETQANCYQAFFDTLWNNDWLAGVHIWQLRSDFDPNKEINNLDFTPQGKPAEAVIAKGFE